MDPIFYFLTHSFALHATLGVVACILGLAGGWWYWGRFEAQSLLLQSELQQQKDKLQKAGREKDDLTRARDDLQSGLGACQADKARFQKLSEDLRKDLDSLTVAAGAMDSELKSALERAAALQESFETLTTDTAGLREGEALTSAALAGALASLEKERGEYRAYTDRLEAEILSLRGKLTERDRACTELREAGERMQEQMTRLATELIRPEPQTAAAAAPVEPPVAAKAQAENPAAAIVEDPVAMPAAPASEAGPAAKPARAARAKPSVPPASGPIQIDLLQG